MDYEDLATTPGREDTLESSNDASETIASNSLDIESECDTSSSYQNAPKITENIKERTGRSVLEEDVSNSSSIHPDDAKDDGDMGSEDCSEVTSQADEEQEAEVELSLTSQPDTPNSCDERDSMSVDSEECSVASENPLHSPDVMQDEETTEGLTSQPNSPRSYTGKESMGIKSEDSCGSSKNPLPSPDMIQSKETTVTFPSQSNSPSYMEKDGSAMESEDGRGANENVLSSLDMIEGRATAETLNSQPCSPDSYTDRYGMVMESEECSIRSKNQLHSPVMMQEKETSVALTSQPCSPDSCTERGDMVTESEEHAGGSIGLDVPQGKTTPMPTSNQSYSSSSNTGTGRMVMESDNCDTASINSVDVPQGKTNLLAISSQPNSSSSNTETGRMVMESDDCGGESKNTPYMTPSETDLLATSSEPNSSSTNAETGRTIMESEECGVTRENSQDSKITHLPLPSLEKSENSLNTEHESCDATTTTQHHSTPSLEEATLLSGNQSSSHERINKEVDEDYMPTGTNMKSSLSRTIETSLPSDSPGTESRDCADVQTSHSTTLPSPLEAPVPSDNQGKGEAEIMMPSESSIHPEPLPPLPTATTTLESKSGHQGAGEDDKETRNERKVRRGIKRKTPSANKGIQTSIYLLDSNSVFRDRVVDLPMLKREAGVVCVEDLQDLDVAFEEWPILLVSQLKLRDTIIESLNSVIRELVGQGQVLEQDLDYLKLKILELQQEAKKRAKMDQQKSHKTQATEAESQTTEEDLTEAWSRWYYGCWGDYYSECDPNSSSYWPGHYTQRSTVPSRAKDTMEEEAQQKTVEEHEGNANEQQAVNCEKVKERENAALSHHKVKSDDTRHSEKRKKLKAKRKKERHKSEKSTKEETRSKREEELDTEKTTRRRKKAERRREERREESDDNTHSASAGSNILPQQDTTSSKSTKEMNGREEAEEEEGNEKGLGWDVSESITQQVEAAAAQAVVESGYVFQEELGLYYDYNTGYYYNAENGLYYDTKSGTYFYYDHNTQSYQFHSQVSPSETTDTKRHKKKAADRKGKSKSSSRSEGSHEREDGECTESDNEPENEEGCESGEERGEEDMTSPDHHDEEGTAAADVPPSLRLMVVEGGERVRVGELHVVTMNGGTVGRESANAVHLPDLNISKVHAEIEYRTAGPEDHHYFIRDLGSNNGTFVNNVRLSEARQTSSEVEIGHGWEVQFGSVKVKCHLHPGTLTCNECEPGLVLQNLPSQPGEGVTSFKNAKSKEKARRKELKAMQKKYKLTHREAQAASSAVAPGYTDRTLLRQVQKGSDNPYEKTEVASSEVPLRETNRGFTLLQKMGWSKGQGLGKDSTGRKEPVQQVSVVGKAGLGSTLPSALPLSDPWAERRKKQLQVTQERYSQH